MPALTSEASFEGRTCIPPHNPIACYRAENVNLGRGLEVTKMETFFFNTKTEHNEHLGRREGSIKSPSSLADVGWLGNSASRAP